MYAITPKGAGKRVGARSIRSDWSLAAGESFTTSDWQPGMVLAEDEQSLRWPTQAEQESTGRETARAGAHDRIRSAYNAVLAPIATAYTDYEREGWSKQEREASAYQAAIDAGESTPPCNTLSRIAAKRGLDLVDLVGRVLAKVEAYEVAYGDATGIRQRLEGEIEAAYAAGDVATLQGIEWPQE